MKLHLHVVCLSNINSHEVKSFRRLPHFAFFRFLVMLIYTNFPTQPLSIIAGLQIIFSLESTDAPTKTPSWLDKTKFWSNTPNERLKMHWGAFLRQNTTLLCSICELFLFHNIILLWLLFKNMNKKNHFATQWFCYLCILHPWGIKIPKYPK